MPRLVDDVVLDILDTAYRPELHLPDYYMLSRFSLVSKFWAGEAQKRLFGEVWLPTRRRIIMFLAVVRNDSERGKKLGSLVRKLRVGFGTSLDFFTELCMSLPELDALELFIDPIIRFSGPALKTSLQPYSQLLSFTLISSCECNALMLLPLLGSHLEFLSIPRSRYSPYIFMNHRFMPPSSPPQFSLYELCWSGPTVWLKWILSNSTNSLTILELRDTLKDEDFEAILKVHGGKLSSLRLPDQVLSDSAAKALTHCNNLREFKYNHLLTSGIIRYLPTTIEHLEIVDSLVAGTSIRSHFVPPIATDEDGGEFVKWIERSGLFVLTWGKTGSKEMRRLCEALAIEYRFLASPIGSYPGEREELIYADGFPRSCYLSPVRKPPARIETEGTEARPAQATKREATDNGLNTTAGSPLGGSEIGCSHSECTTTDQKENVLIRAEGPLRGPHGDANTNTTG